MRKLKDYIVEGIFDIDTNVNTNSAETIKDVITEWLTTNVRYRGSNIPERLYGQYIKIDGDKYIMDCWKQHLIFTADCPVPIALEQVGDIDFEGDFEVKNIRSKFRTKAGIEGNIDIKSVIKQNFEPYSIINAKKLNISDISSCSLQNLSLIDIKKINWDAKVPAYDLYIRNVDSIDFSKCKEVDNIQIAEVNKIIGLDKYSNRQGQIRIDRCNEKYKEELQKAKVYRKMFNGQAIY